MNKQWCCGGPVREPGYVEIAHKMAEHNMIDWRKTGTKRIICLDPHDYITIIEHYPTLDENFDEFEIGLGVDLIAELIREGKIELTTPIERTVTYHDPCRLNKRLGKWQSPREILRAIPGLTFVDVDHVTQWSYCSGAGSNLATEKPELTAEIRRRRVGTPAGPAGLRPPGIPDPFKVIMKTAGMDPADYDEPYENIRRDVQQWKRKHGPAQGKDYSRLNDDQLTDDYHYLIFPNVTLNVHADDLMLFRQRPHPTDPDRMFYDIWTFELVPEGHEWPERPKHQHFKHGEKSIGLVLDQDAANLPGVQAGMHSAAFEGLWIGAQELRIRHFHKVIDDYVYGPGGKPPGAV